ncbi:unnamed protein product [Durusdinium trenchii]|uniref:Uncharacterized protein n=1 Tax=Durusdinium trenchii TaxID=1381693 RepID=A0ABP0S672_9DINO
MTCPVSCITTWFSGQGAPENHLVQKIPELVLRAGQPDLPFFFSWANEPWTRRWTGLEDVLTAQTYGDEQESRQHFQFLLSFFRRPKYLRINGAAVFATDLVTTWHGLEEGVRRQLARQDGFHEHLLQTIGTSYHVDRQPPDSVTGERGLLSAGTNNGVNGVKAAPKRVLRSPGLAGVTRCGDPDAEAASRSIRPELEGVSVEGRSSSPTGCFGGGCPSLPEALRAFLDPKVLKKALAEQRLEGPGTLAWRQLRSQEGRGSWARGEGVSIRITQRGSGVKRSPRWATPCLCQTPKVLRGGAADERPSAEELALGGISFKDLMTSSVQFETPERPSKMRTRVLRKAASNASTEDTRSDGSSEEVTRKEVDDHGPVATKDAKGTAKGGNSSATQGAAVKGAGNTMARRTSKGEGKCATRVPTQTAGGVGITMAKGTTKGQGISASRATKVGKGVGVGNTVAKGTAKGGNSSATPGTAARGSINTTAKSTIKGEGNSTTRARTSTKVSKGAGNTVAKGTAKGESSSATQRAAASVAGNTTAKGAMKGEGNSATRAPTKAARSVGITTAKGTTKGQGHSHTTALTKVGKGGGKLTASAGAGASALGCSHRVSVLALSAGTQRLPSPTRQLDAAKPGLLGRPLRCTKQKVFPAPEFCVEEELPAKSVFLFGDFGGSE